MIVLFTDFSLHGPYVGQIRAAVLAEAPGMPVIDLMHDAPAYAPRPAAYLLASLAEHLPAGTTFVCVVDPGVGGERRALLLETEGRRFVGPDNGLLSVVARRDPEACWAEILWRPTHLSPSFQGRDLFAPVAARLARGATVATRPLTDPVGADWPETLAEVIYLDGYGNAFTGLSAAALPSGAKLCFGERCVARARTFSDVPPGTPFWYENAQGLAEIAVNRGSAARILELAVGQPLRVSCLG